MGRKVRVRRSQTRPTTGRAPVPNGGDRERVGPGEAAFFDLFGTSRTADSDWRNRLIWGDNKYVLAALLEQLSGKVRLIYIDPPFATGQDFSFRATIESSDFVREASVIEQKAYRDTWGRGIDSFLQMLYERFAIMYDLLTEDGTIYVHMGWEVAPYVRVVLDEIFGRSHYVNQVIWRRQTAHSDVGQGSKHMGPIHDVVLVYGKGSDYQWNMQYQPYSEAYIGAFYNNVEPDTGRRYRLSDITGPGGAAKGNPQYEFLGVTRYWRLKRTHGRDVPPRPYRANQPRNRPRSKALPR